MGKGEDWREHRRVGARDEYDRVKCVCVHVFVCVHLCVCIHVCVSEHACVTCACMCVSERACVHVYVRAHVCGVCARVCVHVMCACMWVHICACV